jgi:hypothetical protein
VKTLLFVYHSTTGGTLQMARAAVAGAAAEAGVHTRLLHAPDAGPADVLDADGFVFATPENLARTPAFKRIHADYGARQIIFEVKNFKDIGRDEHRQMLSYLHDKYGGIGFIVTRDDDENLHAGRELDWVREIYTGHKKLVVRLNAKFFQRLLGKLRSPEKHDVVDKSLNALLDKYERRYLGIASTTQPRAASRRKR